MSRCSSDPAGARTQDPNIKSVVLYQLSYGIGFEGANIHRFSIFQSRFEVMIKKLHSFDRLYIVGYMGSGKSTIAKELSNELKCNYIDLDSYIENQTGLSPTDWIKTKGELAFRKVERESLIQLSVEFNGIIATGGGTPCYFDNMEVMLKTGKTAYLHANPKELANRLSNSKTIRPLLSHVESDKLVEFIAKHLFERAPFYSQAEIHWKATSKELKKWAEEIQAICG